MGLCGRRAAYQRRADQGAVSGHPACHDRRQKPILFGMLKAGQASGITLTESYAMLPTAAVSGFYFGHPEASYFGVARIGRDQLEDYSARRGVDLQSAERWLRR